MGFAEHQQQGFSKGRLVDISLTCALLIVFSAVPIGLRFNERSVKYGHPWSTFPRSTAELIYTVSLVMAWMFMGLGGLGLFLTWLHQRSCGGGVGYGLHKKNKNMIMMTVTMSSSSAHVQDIRRTVDSDFQFGGRTYYDDYNDLEDNNQGSDVFNSKDDVVGTGHNNNNETAAAAMSGKNGNKTKVRHVWKMVGFGCMVVTGAVCVLVAQMAVIIEQMTFGFSSVLLFEIFCAGLLCWIIFCIASFVNYVSSL